MIVPGRSDEGRRFRRMDTTTTIYFVGGHSVTSDLSADDILGGVSDGLHEPGTVMLNLGDGHKLHFNPSHIACIETEPVPAPGGAAWW